MRDLAFLSLLFVCFSSSGLVRGDVFGVGSDSFEMEFVAVPNPGNPSDAGGELRPTGTVNYHYAIGVHEVSERMVESANRLGGLGIPLDGLGPDKPATINWFDAARLVNWLNADSGSPPAYKFDGNGNFLLWEATDSGYNADNRFRNSLATYVLPDIDEWYKAAYYDPASDSYFLYPTGSDNPPASIASGTASNTAVYFGNASGLADVTQAGGLSPVGTMAQGGNADEWNETEGDLMNDGGIGRIFRGGSYHSFVEALQSAHRRTADAAFFNRGFRVVRVPEPASLFLLLSAYLFDSFCRRPLSLRS